MDSNSPQISQRNSNTNISLKRTRNQTLSEDDSMEFSAFVLSPSPGFPPKQAKDTTSPQNVQTPIPENAHVGSSSYKQVLTWKHLEYNNWSEWTLPDFRLPPLLPSEALAAMPQVEIDDDLWARACSPLRTVSIIHIYEVSTSNRL